jgi:(p)ppGpp synthase/HD superfamily hydrolase
LQGASDGYSSGVVPAGTTSNMFVHAVWLAARAFKHNRRDSTRELYLTHSLDVAQALGPDATVLELSTAVLHDILEDTDWTMDDLMRAGVDATVLDAVDTLTRRLDEEDENFVARICATPGDVGVIAQRVKLADLTVNIATADSDESRKRYERSLPLVRARVERNR